jgi:hypothetical protein
VNSDSTIKRKSLNVQNQGLSKDDKTCTADVGLCRTVCVN